MKSVMKKNFSRIPSTEIQRSTFNRSHGYKTAFDSGYLIPFFLDEVLPSDEYKIDAQILAKMTNALISQPMDNIFLETQWFFVPSRLIWTNFTKMMGERVNPRDSIDYLVPQLDSGANGFAVGSLADYFGIPTGVANLKVSALPFRAYAKIWDDWYRDENLQDSIIQSTDDLGDSNGAISWNTLLRRGKRHDYFTSCLPWPQKGEGVGLSISGSAPVFGDGNGLMLATKDKVGTLAQPSQSSSYAFNFYVDATGDINSPVDTALPGGNTANTLYVGASGPHYPIGVPTKEQLRLDGVSSGLYADLSGSSVATINSLRMAFQLQRLLEADARGGTRYCEILRNHFKTISPDARLQRSEYLGGSSCMVNIAQVLNMTDLASSEGGAPVGQRYSIAAGSDHARWHKSFTEHGYIIGLVNVRVDLNYQYGLERMWSRRGRYDYYWPTLAHLGEQAVLNKEIYAQGTDDDELPFGYQERYAEYRYKPSMITGKLRSSAQGTLDYWHLAQKFDSLPVLDDEFIRDNPPIDRVLAVNGEPQFVMDSYIGCICTRPLPVYSIPGLIDHF